MADPWANPEREHAGEAGRDAGTSGTGADLHLDLSGTGTRRAALTRALRDAICSGRLAPGTRLPPSRTLAADLGLARNTVASGYAELVAEGWLTARQGSGTHVAQRSEPVRAGPRITVPPPGGAGGPRAVDRVDHDLGTGKPDASSFPRQAWLTSARRALAGAPAEAFGFGDPRGRPELRRALAGYLARVRGVRADPERIVVCGGVAQGLALLARVLPRETAVEEYGLWLHRDLLTAGGVRTRPLPVDADGACTPGLTRLPSVRAVLLTPAHQYPTGVPLHPDRRAAVVDWARGTGGLVLEDDYDGEFRYDRRPVGALQSLDPERVVYLGTSSKSLSPALRIAWMVLPRHLLEAVTAATTAAEWTVGITDQLTLADFLERGAYDKHVRAMRQRYRLRRDRLVAAVGARAPGVRLTGIAAGLHAVLRLPDGVEESTVLAAAARRGVGLDLLSRFRHPGACSEGRPARPAVIVGYGAPSEHAYTGALDALCRVLEETTGARRVQRPHRSRGDRDR
ncbi:PLP-dependent aminotransferase family protein [Streptomyces ovatisporus]|uniref:PLP-dependent aminotransferase family protein n=1 Tax=Streptomyces ovatisporus TaxID=1128682 RepID=A0ABV8ZZU0_9ACTN